MRVSKILSTLAALNETCALGKRAQEQAQLRSLSFLC